MTRPSRTSHTTPVPARSPEFLRADRHRCRHPTAPATPPPVVVGANCPPQDSTGTTGDGSTAYCSTLQHNGTTIWSLTQGDVPSPTVTTAPTDEPLPVEEESPVRVCMEQTGQTRRECRADIRQSNGLPPLP